MYLILFYLLIIFKAFPFSKGFEVSFFKPYILAIHTTCNSLNLPRFSCLHVFANGVSFYHDHGVTRSVCFLRSNLTPKIRQNKHSSITDGSLNCYKLLRKVNVSMCMKSLKNVNDLNNSFTILLHKYFLSASYGPGIFLCVRDTADSIKTNSAL